MIAESEDHRIDLISNDARCQSSSKVSMPRRFGHKAFDLHSLKPNKPAAFRLAPFPGIEFGDAIDALLDKPGSHYRAAEVTTCPVTAEAYAPSTISKARAPAAAGAIGSRSSRMASRKSA